MVLKVVLAGLILVDAVEEFLVEVGPLLEGIFLSIHARSNAAGNEGSLDGDGSAATHRVDEVALALPSCQHDNACSEDFIQRGLYRLLPVAATMQALSTGVEREGAVVLCDVDVELQVGIGDLDVRTTSCPLPHLVDNRVFHLVSYKLRVSELVREDHTIHGESRLVGQVVGPIDFLYGIIHLVGGGGTEVLDGHEDADCGAELEVRAIEKFLVSCERHHATSYLYIVCTEVDKLCSQHSFKALEGLGYHLELFSSLACWSFPLRVFHLSALLNSKL